MWRQGVGLGCISRNADVFTLYIVNAASEVVPQCVTDRIAQDPGGLLETLGRTRVAILATHPIQYQTPLWRRLAQRPEFLVRVFFGTDMSVRGYQDREFGVPVKWDALPLEGYEHEFLSTDPGIHQIGFWEPRARGLRARLAEFAPNVVLLTAYHGLFHLGGLVAARKVGARVVMRHEASDVAVSRGRWKALARDRVLRLLYSRVNLFAAIGTEARSHLLRLGVPRERIFDSPYCIDSDFMARQADRWLTQRDRLRADLEIGPNDVALVFSGKLIARKNPLIITAAIASLPAALAARLHLIVAGDGELRSSLERAGREVLGRRLHMLGFLNQSEIGRAYAAGDVLLLPSVLGAGETWGLVVNEAMQFGLPAIVSDGVGCRVDLVEDGVTGWSFSSGDAGGLARAVGTAAGFLPAGRLEFRRAVQARVAGFSVAAAVGGLAGAITSLRLPSMRSS